MKQHKRSESGRKRHDASEDYHDSTGTEEVHPAWWRCCRSLSGGKMVKTVKKSDQNNPKSVFVHMNSEVKKQSVAQT